VRGLARATEARAETLQGELGQARADLSEAHARLAQLEQDLSRAMEALAGSEGDSTGQQQSAVERIRELKAENRRLKQENDGELLRVREDLETELRSVSRQLEARDQEIWELREEVIRLRAQSAASTAAAETRSEVAGIHRTLFDQENTIAELREECERLRFECEKRQRSLDVRKKNLRILAALLRQERDARRRIDSEPPAPLSELPGIAADREVDIAKMIDEAVDDFEDVDDALDTVRIPQGPDESGGSRDDS
jgi:chromosome segregation ATPase